MHIVIRTYCVHLHTRTCTCTRTRTRTRTHTHTHIHTHTHTHTCTCTCTHSFAYAHHTYVDSNIIIQVLKNKMKEEPIDSNKALPYLVSTRMYVHIIVPCMYYM